MAENGKGKWVRHSEREWRELLSRFERSGLGVEAFCRREGISAASLYRWRSLLSEAVDRGDVVVHGSTPAFVDLGALNAESSARLRLDLKLDLGEGLVLHLVRS
jgi:putative transposase